MPQTKKPGKKSGSKKSSATKPTALPPFRMAKPKLISIPTAAETITDTPTLTVVMTFVMLIISLAFFSLQLAFALAGTTTSTTTATTPVLLADGAYANPITFNCRTNFPYVYDGLDPYIASAVTFDTARGSNIIYKDICAGSGNIEFDCRKLTINGKTADYLIYKNFPCSNCGSSPSNACIKTQCSDGLDNDNDGQCDYAGCPINGKSLPPDTFCKSTTDTAEGPSNFVPKCVQNYPIFKEIAGGHTKRFDEIQIQLEDKNQIGYQRSAPIITSRNWGAAINYCGNSLGLSADTNKYSWSIWSTNNANPAYCQYPFHCCLKNLYFCGQDSESASGNQVISFKVTNELKQEKIYTVKITCGQGTYHGPTGITIESAEGSVSWVNSQGLICGDMGFATSTSIN